MPLPKKIEPLDIFVTSRDLERLCNLGGKPLENFAEAVRLHLAGTRSRVGAPLKEFPDDGCRTIRWDAPAALRSLLPEHPQDASRIVRAALRAYLADEVRKPRPRAAEGAK